MVPFVGSVRFKVYDTMLSVVSVQFSSASKLVAVVKRAAVVG